MRLNPLLALVPLAVGLGIGALLPRQREIAVEFGADGRTVRVAAGAWQPVPSWTEIPRQTRVALRVVNRDSVWRSAGVLAVAPGDSVVATLDQCLPGSRVGRPLIPLR